MATQVQIRRGTAAENDAFTGAAGELTYDTTNKRVRIHDGGTTGGFELKTENSSGDTLFANGEKAIFGDGGDLQIYHNGSHSFISESGTGDLRLLGTNVKIGNTGHTINYLSATDGAEVTVYYNGSPKLATTSTGIDVTGTVTADGLTVDGKSVISDTRPILDLMCTGTEDKNTRIDVNSGTFRVRTVDDTGTQATQRLDINNATGDISFYEDTGTTPKFFWDASAESLGIGTSSPNKTIDLGWTTTSLGWAFDADPTTYQAGLDFNNLSRVLDIHSTAPDASTALTFSVGSGGNERMRIDSSGNVGIGTSSPSAKLQIDNSGSNASLRLNRTDAAIPGILIVESGSYGNNIYSEGAKPVSVSTNGIERMRIDSSGNLLVGTTSAITQSGTTTGSRFNSGGIAWHITDDAPSLFLGRTSTDGTIIDFRKDGTAVGSIGTTSGDLYITSSASGHEGLRFGNGAIVPVTTDGSSTDNACNLGGATSRFSDLYLSGGVYLGGTGSANKLDDYEEGTWTPVAESANGDASVTTSINTATYTKIGNLVNVRCYIAISVTSVGTGQARISGLPFTNNGGYTPFTSTHETFAGSTGQGWVRPSETFLEFLNANNTGMLSISGTGTKYAMISLTYQTNS
jgi:hypothetical protein